MNKLYLNKSLYSYKSVIMAIDAYSKLAELILGENDKEWIITLQNSKYEPVITLKEFENYAIGLVFMEMKNAGN